MSERSKELIDDLAREIQEDFQRTHQRFAFEAYLEQLRRHPYRLTRTAYQYIRDAILYYGRTTIRDCGRELTRFNLFDDPFFDGEKKLVGQERPVEELFQHIDACARQEEDESIFVLIGPPGTGKSRIFYLIEQGLEDYSRTDEGAAYTFNWLFREKFEPAAEPSQLGFGDLDEMKEEGRTSYANLPEDDIYSRISCPMRDNPLSLIPRRHRNDLLEQLIRAKQERLETESTGAETTEVNRELNRLKSFVLPRKIRELEPCRNCQNIRERLLELYEGDWRKLLKHVEVERFTFSLERGQGIAEVDPGVNVETNLQPIKPGQDKHELSGLLRGLNLFEFYGKPACASRGLLNYQDIFNKDHKQLQHLLSAIEEKTVDFGDVTHKVDFAIFGSTNIPEKQLLEENVLTEGLRDRIEQIDVPYLLNYSREREIYRPNVQEIRKACHISPHTIEMGALFTVLTRLEEPDMEDWFGEAEDELKQMKSSQPSRYERRKERLEKQRELIDEMDLGLKARIYNNDFSTIPPKYRSAVTDAFVRGIREEHPDEGKTGLSPRWFKRKLGNLTRSEQSGCINIFQLYDAILADEDDETAALLDLVRQNYNNRALREVEEALFDVEEQDVLQRVERYLEHAKAYLRDEKVYDDVQEKRIDPDPYLQDEEDFIGLDEDEETRHEHRESVIQTFGSYVDEDVARPDPRVALPALVQRYKRAMYKEMKSDFRVEPFVAALNAYRPDADRLFDPLDPDALPEQEDSARSVYRALNRMRNISQKRMKEENRDPRAGYCNSCAREVIEFVLTNEHTLEQFREVAPEDTDAGNGDDTDDS